jgi:hypothetical protein
MRIALVIALAMPSMDDIIRVFAIVGGAAVGAFVTGFLTQTIIKSYTGQKVPLFVVNILRLLGGVALGWLVYLIVFGHGGSLFGGFGGGGTGKDTGSGGPRETSPAVTVPRDKSSSKDSATTEVDKSGLLRIQVLGDAPLHQMADAKLIPSFDPERSYRLDEDDPANLKTLKQVEDIVRQRLQQQTPPLQRIELVLFKDSPQKQVARVSELKKWIDEHLPENGTKVVVDFKEPGENAPVR